VALGGEEVKSNVNYSMTCPSECTSQLPKPVTIYNSFLHSHLSGMQMWTNLYREGEPVRTIEATAFWSDGNQRPTLFEETELRPGDRLVLGANYDESKRVARGDEPVVWGLGTRNEMMMSFLFVYPRPTKASGKGAVNYCGVATRNMTICSDGLTFENGTDLLELPPIAIDDAKANEGFAVDFGGPVQCQLAKKRGKGGASSDGGNSCFPAHAEAQLEDGNTKRMDELAVGDRVLVAPGEFSPIFMFTHKLRDETAHRRFLRFSTASGHSLTVTEGHYIPTSGRLQPADAVRVGDRLTLGTGEITAVVAVDTVRAKGLFNPQTLHGEIVVDGVVASTYTTAVAPAAAHALLAPLRAMFRAFRVSFQGKIVEQHASSVYSALTGRG
jgi:hypothetical protein